MRPILLQGHTRSLTQIKYNREGDLLFSVSKDNVVNAWFSHNGERLGTYNGHVGAIWTVDVDSTTTLLLTGSADNTARLWEVQTGKLLYTLETKTAVKRVQFSEDDALALIVTEERMGHPGTVTVLDIVKDGDKYTLEPINVIIPEGSKATVAGWGYLNKYIISGHENGSISMWDPKTGEKLKSVHPHDEPITDLQFSVDRTYFITSSKDKSAKIFDANTLNHLKSYTTDTPLNSASLTPKFQEFVVLGGGQEAMNVTTTSQRAGKFECRFYHKIFEEEVGRVKGHFGPINTIAIHPDGKSFSSGGEDGYVRVHHFDEDYYKFKHV
ncbi:WD40 repeat-like protein [Basidiobolus meristosporus CBS 931.73]|uniref:Eukaryotic translation initiation factor 3 subunit I n=1 Tax=Basidiobolus meristosporus CBS 931.73 TaxID=1314790 RepID=A0A1Y1ZCD3_9FUNG|nr:WD40 repeat-like protein [Basidiobolus meristosporus CBS 931.73]|eukprot:ORY07876.1 WD40 repeat-like protein [Basidiobolus meristosporus CBS 931.73]